MKTYLRLIKYLYPYKVIILLTWILSLLVLALQGISVWVGAGFIEKLLAGQKPAAVAIDVGRLASVMDRLALNILQQSTPFKSLIAGVSVLVGASFLITLFRGLKMYIFTHSIESILAKIRTEMFSCLTRLDLSFSRKFRPGEVASLFVKDVEQLKMAIFDVADRIFMQPLRLVMAFFLMYSLSEGLTILIFALMIFSSLLIHFVGDRIESLVKKAMEKSSLLQGHLTEYLSTVILARSLGREKSEIDNFSRASRSLADTNVDMGMINSVAPQVINNLFILSGGIMLLIGGYKVLVSHTVPGTVLIKMALLLPIATYPVQSLSSLYVSVRASLASAKRIFQLMDEKETFHDHADAREAGPLSKSIELKNICYGIDDTVILNNISMTIPRGSRMLIYGPSGAGKTTILSLIAGFARPGSGSILVDGINLSQIKGTSWRRRLGIVIQEPVLLNGTIRENLLYACPDANDSKLNRVLEEALLRGDDCTLSNGLETAVGNRGEMLSGGERQRLTIARALLNDPEILLMDEPTSMLDMESKRKIMDTICSVAKGRTLIIVTHDPVLREIADIEIKIESGKIVGEIVNPNPHCSLPK